MDTAEPLAYRPQSSIAASLGRIGQFPAMVSVPASLRRSRTSFNARVSARRSLQTLDSIEKVRSVAWVDGSAKQLQSPPRS